jgi:glutamate--cysteine ligase
LLSELGKDEHIRLLTEIRRGVEREALRFNDSGLAQTAHPSGLGSALTHPMITTDFSEALVELITPATKDAQTTIAQLTDLHKFTLAKMNGEHLWPVSMPCFIKHEDDIQLAYYGESNVGKMKRLYRTGLKNRYGSMMQAIAGVHFNFSFGQELWQTLHQLSGTEQCLQDFISDKYLGLIRNFKRELWLISYLFGASPALCNSFLGKRKTNHEFETIGKGTLYLPYATALRLGDLGYTNSAQSILRVTYNSLDEYLAGLTQAINTQSTHYQGLGNYQAAEPKQLNGNILQIENEFYSPIRPKRTPKSGQKPSDALRASGIEYIEVRALDVNPFSPVGISLEQMHFLDVFLHYCMLSNSPALLWQEQQESESNLDKVVNAGRQADLLLSQLGKPVSLKEWGTAIFADLAKVAQLLDKAFGSTHYQTTINKLAKAIDDPNLTLSGQYLNALLTAQKDNGSYAKELAKEYQTYFDKTPYQIFSEETLGQQVQQSIADQQTIESSDSVSFSDYLTAYFNQ